MCPDCTEAQTSATWGGYHKDCPQCEIRAIAGSPKRIRQQRYAQVAKEQGEEAMQSYRLAVIAERERMDAMGAE